MRDVICKLAGSRNYLLYEDEESRMQPIAVVSAILRCISYSHCSSSEHRIKKKYTYIYMCVCVC